MKADQQGQNTTLMLHLTRAAPQGVSTNLSRFNEKFLCLILLHVLFVHPGSADDLSPKTNSQIIWAMCLFVTLRRARDLSSDMFAILSVLIELA